MITQLKAARLEIGLSGLELARRAKMAPGDLSRVERGLLFPYPGWRRRLAKALDRPEAELFPEILEAES